MYLGGVICCHSEGTHATLLHSVARCHLKRIIDQRGSNVIMQRQTNEALVSVFEGDLGHTHIS